MKDKSYVCELYERYALTEEGLKEIFITGTEYLGEILYVGILLKNEHSKIIGKFINSYGKIIYKKEYIKRHELIVEVNKIRK